VTTAPGRAPAYQTLAQELRFQISSGRLRPGDRLPTEPELCLRSGLSRSTVREALRLLASENLIITTRGVTGGSYVARPDAATLAHSLTRGIDLLVTSASISICDLVEVRELVDVRAAALAAVRRTDEQLADLEATLFDPVGAGTAAKVAAQRAFHETLVAATGNLVFELLARPLYAVASATEVAERGQPEFWSRIDADHRAILAGVQARDPAAAEAAAREHLVNLRATFSPT
jgi:DNA-binding FadR family transcriptional regulator